MICGYARVSTDGQSVGAPACQHRAAGAGHVSRGTARRAMADRGQFRRPLGRLASGEAEHEIARSCNVSHGTISKLSAS